MGLYCIAVMAEWLRRWTRNPMGNARTGSNPVYSDTFPSTCTNVPKFTRHATFERHNNRLDDY